MGMARVFVCYLAGGALFLRSYEDSRYWTPAAVILGTGLICQTLIELHNRLIPLLAAKKD